MTDPRQITDLPVATTIGDSDLFLLHQGVLDKQVTAAIVLGGCLKVSANLSDLASAGTARTNLGVPAISDVPYLINNLSDLPNKATARANLSLTVGTNVQAWAAQLDAVAANNSTTGLWAQTGTNTVASRTLGAPAAGFTISNPAGVAGNPTFALANDLAAVEGLASNGIAVRTGTDTWAIRALAQPAAGFTITNTDGVSGNPTFVLANDLAALEGLSSTGIAVRSTTDTWVQRSLAAPAAGFTITNPAGVSGDPTFVLANDLAALEGLSSTGIAVRSGSDTWVQRTVTGTANQVDVTNGSGVSGNPTLTLPAQVILPSHATAGSISMREASASGTNLVKIEAANTMASDMTLKLFSALPVAKYLMKVDNSGNVTAEKSMYTYLGGLNTANSFSNTSILDGNAYSAYYLRMIGGSGGSSITVSTNMILQFYGNGSWITATDYDSVYVGKGAAGGDFVDTSRTKTGILVSMYGALYSLELNLTFTGPTSGMYIHGQVLVPGSVGNDGHVVASVGGACKSSSFPITGIRLVNTSITAPTSPGGAGTTIEVWGVTAND